ncbi:MAG: glycoside hydrolase family 2 protein [Planctomycetota bacterium]|jgi:beta-glucuronidase
MPLRTFKEHAIRTVASLDGAWDFITAAERKDRKRLPEKYARTVHVPSAWETLPGYANYRGKAWFRRSITWKEGTHLRLVFGGVSHTARVYLDGAFLGEHYDAFTPFAVMGPISDGKEHELVVEVDNSFGPHSVLHADNDYYTYGGITRPAEIQSVSSSYIDKVLATPRKTKAGWKLDLRLRIANVGTESITRSVQVSCAGKTCDLGPIRLRAGATREISGALAVGRVKPWTAETPDLYSVTTTLSDTNGGIDDLIDRVGFRTLAVKGRKFLLNGKPFRLRGVNRHEDHPQFGCALPLEAMIADLELIADLNCNFIRTAHYPNDQRFLDLCDERGFYVWEESHARGRPVDFRNPLFRKQIRDSTVEMLEWHHNHASIVIWGCLNECESDTSFGRKQYKYVIDLIKKGDPSRPVTFASCVGVKDLCHDLVDIVSINRYDAWYSGDGTSGGMKDALVKPHQAFKKWLNTKESGACGKPMIQSEFGAGAFYGWRAPRESKWTEEYQARALEASLELYLNDPAVVGASIWQFCDVRVTTGWFETRPRTMNNKGVVDEYRRPKLCYDVVKHCMQDAAHQAGEGRRNGQ